MIARGAALNEQELWRDMVRWSGGLVHEEDGLLFVAGPSRYLRVVIRLDGHVDGAEGSYVRADLGVARAERRQHRDDDQLALARGQARTRMDVTERPVDDPVAEGAHAGDECLAAGLVVELGQAGEGAGPAIGLVSLTTLQGADTVSKIAAAHPSRLSPNH